MVLVFLAIPETLKHWGAEVLEIGLALNGMCLDKNGNLIKEKNQENFFQTFSLILSG